METLILIFATFYKINMKYFSGFPVTYKVSAQTPNIQMKLEVHVHVLTFSDNTIDPFKNVTLTPVLSTARLMKTVSIRPAFGANTLVVSS